MNTQDINSIKTPQETSQETPQKTLKRTAHTNLFTLVNDKNASLSSRIYAGMKLFSDLATSIEELDLHTAIVSGNLTVIKLIIEAGADVNKIDWRGETPLHLASSIFGTTGLEIMSELLHNGADINKLNNFKITPLGEAIQCWNVEAIKFLITNGADVNKQCLHGTPLILILNRYFWFSGFTKSIEEYEIIRLLIENGADVNTQTRYGITPLMIACFHKLYRIAKLLLRFRARTDLADEEGLTVWDIIKNFSDKDYKKYKALLKKYTK